MTQNADLSSFSPPNTIIIVWTRWSELVVMRWKELWRDAKRMMQEVTTKAGESAKFNHGGYFQSTWCHPRRIQGTPGAKILEKGSMATNCWIGWTLLNRKQKSPLWWTSFASTPISYFHISIAGHGIDSCITNSQIYDCSRSVTPPWPQKLLRVGSTVASVAFLPDGECLACGSDNTTVRL